MSANSNDDRSQSRLEKAARESGSAEARYEAEAQEVREKMARLRALRLAKEAAEGKPVEKAPARSKKPAKSGKAPAKGSVSLSEWLDDQEKSGRRG